MFIPFTYMTEKTAPIGEWSLEMLPRYFDNKLWLNLYSISHLRKLEKTYEYSPQKFKFMA